MSSIPRNVIGKHHLKATEALLVSRIPVCPPPPPTSSPAHRQHTCKNKQKIRYQQKKAACCWPTWKWPRSGGEGREPWKPAAGPRAKVCSPVDWRPSSPEERAFCCRAKHHTPPRMIDALSAPCSRKKALDICIID